MYTFRHALKRCTSPVQSIQKPVFIQYRSLVKSLSISYRLWAQWTPSKDKMANSPTREVSHVIKFNGKNFPLWKFGCWLKLEQHDLMHIVNGNETLPEQV